MYRAGHGNCSGTNVCQVTGLPPEKIIYDTPDTKFSPNAGNTTASRQTLFTGEAAVRAAKELKAAIDENGSLESLDGREFYGEYTGITDKWVLIKKTPSAMWHTDMRFM